MPMKKRIKCWLSAVFAGSSWAYETSSAHNLSIRCVTRSWNDLNRSFSKLHLRLYLYRNPDIPMPPLLQWYTLNDVKSGRVHLVLEWLPRVSDLPRLEQVRYLLSLFYFFISFYLDIPRQRTNNVVIVINLWLPIPFLNNCKKGW